MTAIRLFLLALTLAPPPAGADIFADLSGSFGAMSGPNTCAENPHSVTFLNGRSRARFVWEHPIIDFRGQERLEGSYEVLGHDATAITLRIEGESRLTEAGLPVVWILRVQGAAEGYCWGRTDWPAVRCENPHIRCPGAAPIS